MCSMYWYSSPLCSWTLFHCWIYQFGWPFHRSVDIWIVCIFMLLWIRYCEYTLGECLYKCMFSFLLNIYLNWNYRPHGNSVINILRTGWAFSVEAVLLFNHTSNEWGFQFLHILFNTCGVSLCDYSNPNRYEFVSHCDFDLYFPNDCNIAYLFIVYWLFIYDF